VIGRYAILASRIRQDLVELESVVGRAERAIQTARQQPAELDLLVDAAALNLHDLYGGLERIFELIAEQVDSSVPAGRDWHRALARQMTVEVAGLRPQVISMETATRLDEYRRFRHVVRNVYAFSLDSGRVEQLAAAAQATFRAVRDDLLAFAIFLDGLAIAD
jgi:hypothetical protein